MPGVLRADPVVCRAVNRFRMLLTNERRRCPRQPFPVVRPIAEATGQEVPEQAAFFPARCHDFSTHGFSFLAKSRPHFKSLVLALETTPDPIYMAAEVRHCTDVLVHPSGQVEVLHKLAGRDDYQRRWSDGAEFSVLVGCEFTGRLSVPENQKPASG